MVQQFPRVRIVTSQTDRSKTGLWIDGQRLGGVNKIFVEATRDFTSVTFTMSADMEIEADDVDAALEIRNIETGAIG